MSVVTRGVGLPLAVFLWEFHAAYGLKISMKAFEG